MKFNRYFLYGLGVHSQIPLWGDGADDCGADIRVLWRRSGQFEDREDVEPGTVEDADEIRLSWPLIGQMTLRAGRELIMDTDENVELTHLRHLVSGVGLGLALHQRGVFTLHAGAIAIDGRAVAIVGPKGAGKSTLAGALNARGHTLLSDDVVALDLPEAALPQVRPGAANINLWPDSALATGHDPTALHAICSQSSKLAGWFAGEQQRLPVPLSAIIFLTNNGGSAGGIRLSPLDAFAQLVGHSHAFRWVDDNRCLPRHLLQCRKVLEQVPMFRLDRGQSLDSLPGLVQLVEEIAAAGCPPVGVSEHSTIYQWS